MSNLLNEYRLITKLSSRDFVKNVYLNIYYVVTMIIFTAIIYGINAIWAKDYVIRDIALFNIDNIIFFAKAGAVFFLALAMGITVYIDNYLFNYQKEKYYLLRTMGISKGLIFYKIFIERLIGAVIGCVFGSIIGIFLNFYLTSYVLDIMNVQMQHSFILYGDSLFYTICEIIVLLLTMMLQNKKRFKPVELKDLLKVERKISAQKAPSLVKDIFVLGIVLLTNVGIVAYYSHIRHFKEIADNQKNMLLMCIVCLVVLAMRSIISLFINSKIRKRKSGCIQEPQELILLTELTSYAKRMKYMLFASSAILLFCVLTPIMADIFIKWSASFNRYKGNLDIEVISIYNGVLDPDNIGIIDVAFLEDYLGEYNVKIQDAAVISNYIADPATFLNRKRGTFPPYIISLRDYNDARRISGLGEVALSEGEFLVHKYKTEKDAFPLDEIILSNGHELDNSGQEYVDSVGGELIFNNDNNYVIVVNCEDIRGLLNVSETVLIDTEERISYEKAKELEETIINKLNEYNHELYVLNDTGDKYYALFDIQMGTISNNQFVTFTILVRLLSVYLFVVGAVLTMSILSLNYLLIMKFHLENEKIYRQIGINLLENENIKRKESAYIYMMPLIDVFICLNAIFLGYILINYEEINAFVSFRAVLISLIQYFFIVVLMACLYAIVTRRLIKKQEVFDYVK